MEAGTSTLAQQKTCGGDRVRTCALSLFASRGYQGVSLRTIAASAGMLAGSLYHHLESKQQLLHELIEDHLSALLFALRSSVALADTPAQKLHRYVNTFIQVQTAHPEGALLAHYEWRSLAPEYLAAVSKIRAAQLGMLQGIFASLFRDDIAPVRDSRAAARMVLGMLEAVPDLIARRDEGVAPGNVLQMLEATLLKAFPA